MARFACRVGTAHHDRQPLQPLVPARPLAAPVRGHRRHWRGAAGPQPRQHPRQGAPLDGGRRSGEWQEAIGGSRGGHTSKIHDLADDGRRPVALGLKPGHVADISMAVPLLHASAPTKRLIADKAYDAESLRCWRARRRIKAAILSAASSAVPSSLDRRADRRRNRIERLVCRLENRRRLATRYDRLARNDLASLALIAAARE